MKPIANPSPTSKHAIAMLGDNGHLPVDGLPGTLAMRLIRPAGGGLWQH